MWTRWAERVVRNLFIPLLMLCLIAGCSVNDKPFSLVNDSNTPLPGGGGGGGTAPIDGCVVNFFGQMQLQLSAQGVGDLIDTTFIDIPAIPIIINGSEAKLDGATFPDIPPYLGDDPPADMIINGDVPGNMGVGTYDAATGQLTINDFSFLVQVFVLGTVDGGSPIDTFTISSVKLTTEAGQKGTGSGPTPEIVVDGQPYNAADGSITMVVALSLPDQVAGLSQVNDAIGGGALTAMFVGTLDQDPSNCTEGGGGTPPPGGPVGGPSEFSIAVDDQKTSEVNFGTAQVITTSNALDQVMLDCREATNRGPILKTVTLKNTSSGDRKIKILTPQDTDDDAKDPLCSGQSEFVRGTITTHGNASCQTVSVGDKVFDTIECTIPEGDDESALSFPLMYVPFNYVTPAEGEQAQPDTGVLLIQYDDGKSFDLKLTGRSEPDTRDVFSVSKVKEGTVSKSKIVNKGLIKLSLSESNPFTQTLALNNEGSDTWEEITFSLGSQDSAFSVAALPADTTLPPASGDNPGQVQFDLTLTPVSDQVYSDTLTITMVRSGSKNAENPEGSVSTLTYNLSGTVGIPTLSGNVKLYVDFLSAKIDHSNTTNPVESLDFRMFPEQAPPPLDLIFADIEGEDSLKSVTLEVENKSVLDKSQAERKTSLRILNAQATVGKSGNKLVPGDDSSLCYDDPDPINIAYQDGDCSYFYFNVFGGETAGLYDDDSAHLTVPDLTLRIENPYHSDIVGNWLASDPNGNPTNILDTTLNVSLTTYLVDQKTLSEEQGGLEVVPDPRVSPSALSVKGKKLGAECPEDIFNHNPSQGNLADKHPHLRCYLSTGDRYMQGREVALRPGQTTEYDVVLVGVGRFPSEDSDPNLPWFMGQNGGSIIYVAIQGRLIVE